MNLIQQPSFNETFKYGCGKLSCIPDLYVGRPPVKVTGGEYYSVDETCVGYWAFWDGTAKDHSIYGNDATIDGPTFQAQGALFDNLDDKLIVPAHASLRPTTAVSVYIWFNATSFAIYDSFVNAGSNGGSWNKGYILWYHGAGEQGMTWGINSYVNAAMETSNPSTGVWYFYAGTYDKVEIAEYRNTVKTAIHPEYANDIIYKDPPEDLLIGYGTAGSYVHGLIGEVLIFNTGKTQDNIDDYYAATKARYGL